MKKFLVALLALGLLVAGVIFGLPFVLVSDSARQEFSKRISAVSGMTIALGGPVNFSVYPDFGLVAKDVKLALPDGRFSVSVSEIISSVKLTSILSGRLEVTGLTLRRPEITVVASDRNQPGLKTVQDEESKSPGSDPFAAAINQLERLSLKNVSISNGTFISRSVDGSRSIISNIDAELTAPDLDGQIDLALSAVRDNQNISLTAAISALRPILLRQPSKFELALQTDPAPHPVLASLTASGEILLSEEGSYEIADGRFTSLDQPLRLDAIYRPGQRPYARLNLEARRVDLGKVEKPPVSQTRPGKKIQGDIAVLDISPLADIDGEVSVKIDSFRMDDIEAREIDLGATLNNGVLDIDSGQIKIANGTVAVKLSTDAGELVPEFKGSISASALKISDVAQLAKAETPVTGKLGLELLFGFRGLNEDMIKESLNLSGEVRVSDGRVAVAGVDREGQSAKAVSDLNFEAEISDVQKPIDIDGNMVWNGEAITFGSVIAPHEFIRKNAGRLSLSISSRKFIASYLGKVNLNGSAVGQLELSVKSLGELMAWAGQGGNSHLGAFSYKGKISVDAHSLSFDKASFALDDIKGSGSGLIDMYGKPSLVTDLSFDRLDIAAILGGEAKLGADAKSASQGNNNRSEPGNVPIDLSALKGFDAHIKLKARQVRYGKVVAGPVNTALIVKDGIARMALPATPFYGGEVLANISADGSGVIPAIDIDAKLSNIDALPLFGDAADFRRIEGKLDSSIKIKGAGKTNRLFAKSLKGSSSAKFTNGAIKGVNIARIYNNLQAVIAGGFQENQDEKTDFTELGLSFQIDKGIAVTDDIKLVGPLVKMDGAGQVDLGEENIDIRLNPLVVLSATQQSGELDVGGVGIPVLINGPLNNPRVYPDLKGIMKNPEAAIGLISKLGLKIEGLGNVSNKPVGNIIGNLISKTVEKRGDAKIGGTQNLVNSLIEQAFNAKIPNAEEGSKIQDGSDNSTELTNVGTVVTGQVPFPTRNPRRQVPVNAQPASVQKQLIDQVVPKLNLPIEDSSAKQTLENLLKNQLQ